MDKEIISQYQAIVDAYNENHSIKEIASKIGVSVTKVRRVLITEGLWSSRSSRKVGELHAQGLSTQEITERLGISDKAVESYLPYSKGVYGDSNRSDSAIRSEAYRERNLTAAEKQVTVPEEREKLAERNDSMRQASEHKAVIEDGREIRAMLLRLELITDSLNAKERGVLSRYGRAEHGIARDVIVPAGMTLHALHYAIQRVFGWQNSHLHNFQLPEEVLKKLIGEKLKYSDWEPLCGLYFRFPSEDMSDLYWDDDYEGETSIKTWMREKYSSPYFYGGFSEHYMESQMRMRVFRYKNPEVVVPKTFEEWRQSKEQPENVVSMGERCKTLDKLSIDEFNRTVETNIGELLERLTVNELFLQEGMTISADDQKAIQEKALAQQEMFEEKAEALLRIQRRIMEASESIEKNEAQGYHKYNEAMYAYDQFIADTETEVVPIADTLLYEYDYGDGWKVKITCKGIYPVEIGRKDTIMKDYWVLPITEEQVFNDVRAYDWRGHKITGMLRDQIARVIAKQRPLCIAADGLKVMDDVGGPHGYCEFLTIVHEADEKEAEDMKEWARGMGWTGRRSKPENML